MTTTSSIQAKPTCQALDLKYEWEYNNIDTSRRVEYVRIFRRSRASTNPSKVNLLDKNKQLFTEKREHRNTDVY